jgi:hypothetical protein
VAVRGDFDHRQVGDDEVDAFSRGQRVGARFEDAGLAFARGVLHRHDDATRARREVHRAADAAAGTPRQGPVREVALRRHLQSAEDRKVQVPTAHHRERRGAVEVRGTRDQGDGLAAGVD